MFAHTRPQRYCRAAQVNHAWNGLADIRAKNCHGIATPHVWQQRNRRGESVSRRRVPALLLQLVGAHQQSGRAEYAALSRAPIDRRIRN